MTTHGRFSCPSSGLSPSVLLNSVRSAAGTALLLALALHASLTLIRGLADKQQVTRPLTTKFVKRAPRLTKPLEMKKRPSPKRRRIQRQMVSVKARLAQGQAREALHPAQTLGGLAKPRPRLSRSVSLLHPVTELQVIAGVVKGTREPASKVDMSLELLDIGALDTGRYHALVIVDPTDKRGIRGFLHLAYAYPSSATLHSKWGAENLLIRCPRGISRLASFVNEHTGIRTDYWATVTFDSREMLKVPWLYVSPHRLYDYRLTASEAEAVGRYLLTGGFVFGDTDLAADNGVLSPEYPALLQLLQQALLTQGLQYDRHAAIEELPSQHPILHCYYDFPAPPIGHGADLTRDGHTWQSEPWRILTYQERTLAVLCNQFYVHVWAYVGVAKGWEGDPTRAFQFGVNTIIFALTQEGSITKRVMDTVAY